MNDQISEKMARKLARQVADYTCYEQADQLDAESRCMRAWRSAGLIKSSKLDEAREFCDNARGTIVHGGGYGDGYRTGVLAAEARFEAAIAELEESKNV